MVRYYSLVIVFVLCVSSSYATKVVDVDSICKSVKDPAFCSSLLNSKPGGAKGANLTSLAQYTIDVLHANLTNSLNLIKTLIAKSGSDANARKHYHRCLSFFVSDGGALSLFEDIERLFKQRKYFDMGMATGNTMVEFALCTLDPNYQDTSLLPKYFGVFENVAEVIMIISYSLSLG